MKLPTLPEPAVKRGQYAGPPGEGAKKDYFDADQMRRYGELCAKIGIDAVAKRWFMGKREP